MTRMRDLRQAEAVERVAAELRQAALAGTWDGRATLAGMAYMDRCRRVALGMSLIFTRDAGHHSSGWMKNPDYERCWHLSMSPAPALLWTPHQPEVDDRLRDQVLRAVFRDHLRSVWAESPKSRAGRSLGVWHWRLFADEHWRPILPRGEVYSTELTELGWRTASEVGVEITSTVDPS